MRVRSPMAQSGWRDAAADNAGVADCAMLADARAIANERIVADGDVLGDHGVRANRTARADAHAPAPHRRPAESGAGRMRLSDDRAGKHLGAGADQHVPHDDRAGMNPDARLHDDVAANHGVRADRHIGRDMLGFDNGRQVDAGRASHGYGPAHTGLSARPSLRLPSR